MERNKQVIAWLEISTQLLRELMPAGAGMEIFGHGMAPADFSALAERESARVDEALVNMATAQDKMAVRAIFAALSKSTIIALFSRWAHYMTAWKEMQNQVEPQLWIPPRDTWRAVFLAMTVENTRSTDAARFLWPEVF